jgi:hypothetical protein
MWCSSSSKTTLEDSEWPSGKAAVDFYFIQDDGGMFKATMAYEPYFIVACKVCFGQSFLSFRRTDASTGGKRDLSRRVVDQEV